MKKFILCLLAICFFVLPINIYAVGVREAYLSCNGETAVGKDFNFGLRVDFSDLDKNKNIGVWFIGFELEFDDTIFTITDISSAGFKSNLYKQDGKYYVLSEVTENVSPNTCATNQLYCSNYLIVLKVHTNKTDKTSSSIAVKDLEIATLDMTDETKEYTLNDANSLTPSITGGGKINITIKPSTEQIMEEAIKSITEDSAPVISTPHPSRKTTEKKNNNSINSNSNTTNKAETNKPVEGRDSYKIDLNKDDDNDLNYLFFNIKIDKKIVHYGAIGLAAIVGICIIVFIIIKIKDCKINKQLKNFDKF